MMKIFCLNFSVVTFYCLFLLFSSGKLQPLYSQKAYQITTVAFYNVENLFDTSNSVDIIYADTHTKRRSLPREHIKNIPNWYSKHDTDTAYYKNTYDEEFTPSGKLKWNSKRYKKKLDRIASVITKIGVEETKKPPSIIGLAEVENTSVLKDLANNEKMAAHNYDIVHFESPDNRGIDVALLYQKHRFKILYASPYSVSLAESSSERPRPTRDILYVKGMLDGEVLHVFVNHWSSRRGGEKKSAPKRMKAAQVCRQAIDSIFQTNAKAKIIALGDFNDDPNNKSLQVGLRAKSNITKDNELYNPMIGLKKQGAGSLAYRDRWNLFDQIILSKELTGKDYTSFKLWKASVFNPPYLLVDEGNFKNYPWRTYAGGNYAEGYSDHLPVFVHLIKERQQSKK